MTGNRVSTAAADFRPVSTVEAAAAAIRHAIATGAVRPGDRIKEIPFAASMGLSRGPVREALRLVAEEGLITLTLNVGATVADVGYHDLMELYAQRLMLGGLALRSLAVGPHDLEDATARLEELGRAAKRKDAAAAVEAGLQFQDSLMRSTSMQRTVRLFERTTTQLRVYAGMLDVDYRPLLPDMHQEEVAFLALVRSRDLDQLQAAWRSKIEKWLQILVHQLGEPFDPHVWRTVYAGDPESGP